MPDPALSTDLERIDSYIDANGERWVQLRRYLHAHPEPSGEEYGTTRYLAEYLTQAGLDCTLGPDSRGLWAEPQQQNGGGCVAIRGDIDALRLRDEKNVPYHSTVDGITHACGHDAHATIVVAAAMALAATGAMPNGQPPRWRLILQPAEETSEGARDLVRAGVMQNVRSIVGLHVDPARRLGKVGFRRGTMTAFCDEVDIVVDGKGGHAARPYDAADPIAVAAQLVGLIYQTLPRAVDARQPAVLTFGSFHGGASRNVIPSRVDVRGTMRTHDPAVRDRLEQRILELALGLGQATGTDISVTFKPGPDAVVNDDRITSICETAARTLLGDDAVEPIDLASMGGEDFADYLSAAPGCFFRLGVASDDRTSHPLHSGRFDLDERAINVGAKLIARCASSLAASDT
jgi:amidohydrolase